ncbi:photosystem II assembly protein Psb34 [Spirulina major]|jgi:hypothetical protein|uniref:photosystem II assembly protein Psb34 n=1 Tax=Spirulina major TaxID=270636 RepID=UPI0011149882|nr:ssl1498 family light-harvesting-like protein [Spirulina major]
MPYTKEEGGRINNFAVEPDMYVANPPSSNEKRNYAIGGVLALVVVSGVVFLAFSVS